MTERSDFHKSQMKEVDSYSNSFNESGSQFEVVKVVMKKKKYNDYDNKESFSWFSTSLKI